MRPDVDELICGPQYIGLNELTSQRDVEEQGQSNMLDIPRYGQRGLSGKFRAFRCPPFSEPLAFDPTTRFRGPHEEGNGFVSVSLVAPGFDARNRSSRSASRVAPPGEPFRRNISRQSSAAATSIALLDLYVSDEEEEARRRDNETPWENLRHKSIKRNILEQVEKEKKWMDSIRSPVAGSSRSSVPFAGKFSRREDDVPTVQSVSVRPVAETSVTPLERRRGHVRADSDLFTDGASPRALSNTAPLRVRNPSSRSTQRQSQETTAPEVVRRVPATGVRPTFAWLRDEDKNQSHSPLPTNESQSRSRSRSQTSPVKPMSSLPGTQNNLKGRVPIRRDVLPESAAQLMNPFLESQLCFIPVPPRPMGPRLHSRTTSSGPTKIPGPSSGRKSVGEGIKWPRPEHTGG